MSPTRQTAGFTAKARESGGCDQRPDRLCKQEVTGSIPVGSIRKALQTGLFSDSRQRAI
jgi:hypothetical protein